MSLFAKAQQAAQNVTVEEKDTLGGSFTVPSNVYAGGVKMAYIDAWKSGALFISLELALLVDGKERTHKETITISNKEGAFTYLDKRSGEQVAMPGYAMIDTLCKTITGKGFTEQVATTKGVKVYDAEAKGEVVQEREVFMDLLGKKIHFGILEQEVDKTAKDPMTSEYEPTGETKKENVLDKVFTEDKKTYLESVAQQESKFMGQWLTANEGKLLNKVKGKKDGAKAGAPKQASSLFPA